jgi:hypothetical protein
MKEISPLWLAVSSAANRLDGPNEIRLRFHYQSRLYRLRSFHAISADFI